MLIHSSFEYELNNGVSVFSGWNAPIYHTIDYVFVKNICQTAVPIFFIFAGFLFFIGVERFDFSTYKLKIKRRVTSLLVPYIIWNTLILIMYVLVQHFMPSMVTGRNKSISDYTVQDYVYSFWSMGLINNGGINGPIDSPLWFVRDLMVISLLSPVIFILCRYFKILYPIACITALILGLITGIQGLSTTAICYFSIGAFFGIFKIDFSKFFLNLLPLAIPIYLITLVYLAITRPIQSSLMNLNIMVGIIMLIGITRFFVEIKGVHDIPFLTESIFFIYASHSEILKVAIRITSKMGIQNDIFYCIAYFACPCITLIMLLGIYWLLKKHAPNLTTILSGGR